MKRPVVWAVIFMICGIYMRLGISAMMCLASFLFAVAAISCFVIVERNFWYAGFLLLLLAGFLLAGRIAVHGETEGLAGKAVFGEGIVKDIGTTSGGNQSLTLLCDLEEEKGERWEGQKAYVIWTGETRAAVGDRVRIQGTAEAFSVAAFPGGYDEKAYLETKRFSCKLFLEEMETIGREESLSAKLAAARLRLQGVLTRVLPPEESSIMRAMLTGEREDISGEVRELYTKAGVTHILCISGLHMSVLALYISFFVENVCKRTARTAAAVTIAASLGFLIFVGPTPSSVRAVVMITIVMLGRICYRVNDRLNDIAVAAMLILAVQPRFLWNAGFQLSFLTVMGLCIAGETAGTGGGVLEKLKEALRFSLYASLFSFPVVAYHFYGISLAGILANLVILPLSGILLGAGILSVALGLFCIPAGIFAAGSVYVILQIYKAVCTVLATMPFGYILTGRPSLLVILLYYALLLFLLRYGREEKSWKKAAVLCAVLWCVVFENQLFRRENTVMFLDVGQGDAAVVSTYDGRAFLVDGGGVYGKERGENKGATVVLPYLESLGIREVTAAFVSHPDSDHMTGILEVMDEMPVQAVCLSAYPFAEEEWESLKTAAEENGSRLYFVKADDISSDGDWECLYPLEGVAFRDGDGNHGSMLLRYTYGGTKVLFTGDLGSLDERLLVERETELSADILKVPHHGSKNASELEFLESAAPQTAVISCGRGNIYGHPSPETLERLGTVAENIYRTDLDGSIIVTLSHDGDWKMETMAGQKPFYERMPGKVR